MARSLRSCRRAVVAWDVRDGGVEVVVGAMLLANRYVPLALALLAANVVNIVLFHAFLAPAGVGPASASETSGPSRTL